MTRSDSLVLTVSGPTGDTSGVAKSNKEPLGFAATLWAAEENIAATRRRPTPSTSSKGLVFRKYISGPFEARG